MFWLFLGKSALKKNPFSGLTSGILIAIVLLLVMLGGLVSVAILTKITNPVDTAVQAVKGAVSK